MGTEEAPFALARMMSTESWTTIGVRLTMGLRYTHALKICDTNPMFTIIIRDRLMRKTYSKSRAVATDSHVHIKR